MKVEAAQVQSPQLTRAITPKIERENQTHLFDRRLLTGASGGTPGCIGGIWGLAYGEAGSGPGTAGSHRVVDGDMGGPSGLSGVGPG
ncbi:hypothetical protein KSX_20050 [Ktedonospora formicarum]|uniref:Uncharacterized protein n=1 Tax=Ktedonospora formicarum TaxID=2778364 RepID=A0A8J3MPI0_9CHLR|nr:hypothetical protein KSX_20050 [Ktedonospora formicarum]